MYFVVRPDDVFILPLYVPVGRGHRRICSVRYSKHNMGSKLQHKSNSLWGLSPNSVRFLLVGRSVVKFHRLFWMSDVFLICEGLFSLTLVWNFTTNKPISGDLLINIPQPNRKAATLIDDRVRRLGFVRENPPRPNSAISHSAFAS